MSHTTTTLPELKLPEGYVVRHITIDDVEALTALVNYCARQVDPEKGDIISVEGLRHQFSIPGISVEDNVRVIHYDGEMVAAAGVVPVPPFNQISLLLEVHPDHRRPEIDDVLLEGLTAQARLHIHKAEDDVRVIMRTGTNGKDTWKLALLEKHSFERVRGFWTMAIEMDEAPPEPEWAAGFDLRPFDESAEMLRAVYDCYNDTFKDHWGHTERADEEAYEQWKHMVTAAEDYDPEIWFLVYSGDEMAGFSVCRPEESGRPDSGYVWILGVRRDYRKKGLAKALLHHTFGEFYRRGKKRVSLGVDAENLTGATRLYESVGMSVVDESFAFEKELRTGRRLET